ncbi:hypothetical protein E2C01_048644 [Portunus trituberculatus]|uniref:Uncharacterized protein n=1 Tax=Portunus trituberculatus TaxID=210409 RepID=A0A5B7GAR2_PORTR|nr:hypothetical protein [Portunus trituberculatus]
MGNHGCVQQAARRGACGGGGPAARPALRPSSPVPTPPCAAIPRPGSEGPNIETPSLSVGGQGTTATMKYGDNFVRSMRRSLRIKKSKSVTITNNNTIKRKSDVSQTAGQAGGRSVAVETSWAGYGFCGV